MTFNRSCQAHEAGPPLKLAPDIDIVFAHGRQPAVVLDAKHRQRSRCVADLVGAEIKGTITAGAIVKLHFITNADGSLSVREVEIADPAELEDDHLNDDNSNVSDVGSNHEL